MKKQFESDRNYRPVLALERSPFYPNLLMTVHDFQFAIWDVSLDDMEEPIFRSATTNGSSHNTCGAWSPTRPGVIFITKTDGVEVWDFVDQSHKATPFIPFSASQITTFEIYQHQDGKQYLAFGEESEGTLHLYEIPTNYKSTQGDEFTAIKNFWNREVEKCYFVAKRHKVRKEEYQKAEQRRAVLEAQRQDAESKNTGGDDDPEVIKEKQNEEAYLDLLMKYKEEFGMISEEELEKYKESKKKKR